VTIFQVHDGISTGKKGNGVLFRTARLEEKAVRMKTASLG